MPTLEGPFGKDVYARYAPTIFQYFLLEWLEHSMQASSVYSRSADVW